MPVQKSFFRCLFLGSAIPRSALVNIALRSAILLSLALAPIIFVHADEQDPQQDPQQQLVNRIVALVNNDVITQLELDSELKMIKNQLRQQNTPSPSDAILSKQVLEKLVLQRIQLQLAEQRHISVNDETLNREIDKIAQANGMDIYKLQQAMRNDGIEFADYRERLRNEIITFRLQQREVTSKVIVTEQEIDSFLANQAIQGTTSEEYRIGHILIVVPEASTPTQIQASRLEAQEILDKLKTGADFGQMAIAKSDGQQALSGGDLGWRKLVELPTLFADLIIKMQPGEISDLVRSPSGFHIFKLMEKRENKQQHIVQQTKVRHILIKPSNVVSLEDAKNKIIELKLRIQAGNDGDDFASIAKTYSDDKGSAVDGGDLGWVNPGVMVRPFEEAMNELQPDELSQPVRTQFGWHLIEVLDRREINNTKEFEKNKAQDILRQQKVEPALDNWLRRIRDEAFVDVRI